MFFTNYTGEYGTWKGHRSISDTIIDTLLQKNMRCKLMLWKNVAKGPFPPCYSSCCQVKLSLHLCSSLPNGWMNFYMTEISDRWSPWELVSRYTLGAAKYNEIYLDSYCEVHDKLNIITLMQHFTHVIIAMGLTSNLYASCNFFAWSQEKKLCGAGHLMPQIAINLVENWAEKDAAINILEWKEFEFIDEKYYELFMKEGQTMCF